MCGSKSEMENKGQCELYRDLNFLCLEYGCTKRTNSSSCRKQLRNAATRTFHDPNAIYSELILWRVDHIGPLSCTGGVSELARINSLHTSAFSNVAWLPTLIPSSVLGK